jgi:CDP-glucose 4,6-dehydratase
VGEGSGALEALAGLKAFKDKRVLVTGHTGFKGSWLCSWLLELGAQPCGYSFGIPTRPSHFELLGLEKKMEDRRGDIRDSERLGKAFKEIRPHIVFHLAAQPLVRASYDDPKGTFDTNVGGTVNVLECIRKSASVRAAVLVATDKCYDSADAPAKGFKEGDRLGGPDPYSASKAAGELAFEAYQRSFFQRQPKLSVASARAGNVIGGGDWSTDRIIPDCVRAWTQGKSAIVRNPGAIRPWQHVLEPLGGYLALGAALLDGDPKASGESFNFGPGEEADVPVEALLRVFKKHWPKAAWQAKPASDAAAKKEAAVLRLNCEKAKAKLGWKARLSLDEAAKLTCEWYQAHAEGADVSALTLAQIRRYGEKA